MIIFYLVCVIPYILFWISIIAKAIKFLWISYDAFEVLTLFKKVRMNFSIFGFLSVFLGLSLGYSLTENLWILGISGVILLIINLILIKKDYYDKMIVEELKKFENPSEKKEITLTPLQGITLILVILLPFLYFSFPSFQQGVTGMGKDLKADILSSVLLILSVIFSFLWFLLAFIYSFIENFYQKHKQKLVFYGQLLFIIMFLYITSKIIIFNIPSVVPDPYPSVISMVISTSTGLISRYTKEIMGFFSKLKNRGD